MTDLFESRSASPMLIGSEGAAFDSPDYLFELKLDGERGLAYLGNDTELRNKRQLLMLQKFPELKGIHEFVKERCILDGEFIVSGIDGKPDFEEIKRRSLMSNKFKIDLAAAKLPVSFVAYDILYHKDMAMLDMPLTERKRLLSETVQESSRLVLSRVIENAGTSLFELTKQQALEGIVAKKKDSRYYCGKRTKDWIKCKNLLDDDFVVCGYIIKSESVTSLALGQCRGGRLVYKGHVTLGISRHDFSAIAAVPRSDAPYDVPKGNEDVVWIEPRLVCTVKYMEKTSGGSMRQPVFKGLRDDKEPLECVE